MLRRFILLFLCLLPSLGMTYQYEVAACLIFQNEAEWLKEWIEYHKLVGVEHFYLIDNASSDDFMSVLKPYLKTGEVELFHDSRISASQAEHNAVQCGNYEKVLGLASGRVKWLAIIDADEFIVPLKGNSLPSLLKRYEKYGGLYVNWLEFGTSHVEKIPKDRLMIEMLTRCSKQPRPLGKSIVRPERVSHCTDPHRMWYHPPYNHVNSDFKTFDWNAPVAKNKILVHHYMTRDLDHLTNVKYPRRQIWRGAMELKAYISSLENHNEAENRSMARFVMKLRPRMGIASQQIDAADPGCGCKN